MDVHQMSGEFFIGGQVALSMPEGPCLRCMGIIDDRALGLEAQQYGAAGGRPQVVWQNGLLASLAVGFFVQLVSPWHKGLNLPLLLEFDGTLRQCPPVVSSVIWKGAPALILPGCRVWVIPFWISRRDRPEGSPKPVENTGVKELWEFLFRGAFCGRTEVMP